MASGFGLNGGPNRCYSFWQETLGCYVVNAGDGVEGKMKCKGALEDYYECLHHRKEAMRAMKMQAAYRKAEAAHPRELAAAPEQVRSLGLIKRTDKVAEMWTKLPEEKQAEMLANIPEDKKEALLARLK
ncbi:hypothetical protein BDW59DRAFT_145474 [Aspergillus cavernicola]|uniref:NADH dehydrogenase [ubiquinone] iron-sulfur protein 5 n=1 Tax=Aspergillus cavernicola TaxID=176166 RepID=A0ABR4IEA7_9EURO